MHSAVFIENIISIEEVDDDEDEEIVAQVVGETDIAHSTGNFSLRSRFVVIFKRESRKKNHMI